MKIEKEEVQNGVQYPVKDRPVGRSDCTPKLRRLGSEEFVLQAGPTVVGEAYFGQRNLSHF